VPEGTFRLRINYRKSGRAAWLSHLEVTRALERCIRRAGLPYAITGGFSAHMRLAFGPALPVGTASDCEYADVWLTAYVPAPEALAALGLVQAPGMEAIGCTYVAAGEPALTVTHRLASYAIRVLQPAAAGVSGDNSAAYAQRYAPSSLEQAFAALASAGQMEVLKKGKPKVYDLGVYLAGSVRVEAGSDASTLATVYMQLRATDTGSLRPAQLFAAALPEAPVPPELAVTRTALVAEPR
jgi:radical SAM-linked protein